MKRKHITAWVYHEQTVCVLKIRFTINTELISAVVYILIRTSAIRGFQRNRTAAEGEIKNIHL